MTLRDVAAPRGRLHLDGRPRAPQQRLRGRGDARPRRGRDAGGRLPPERRRLRTQAPAHDDDRDRAARDAPEPVLRRGRARHRAGRERARAPRARLQRARVGRARARGRRGAALPAGRGDRLRQAGRPRQRGAGARGRDRRRRGREAALRRGRHRARRQLRRRDGGDGAPARPRPHRASASSASRRRTRTASSSTASCTSGSPRTATRCARATCRRRLARRARRVLHATRAGRASAPATTT